MTQDQAVYLTWTILVHKPTLDVLRAHWPNMPQDLNRPYYRTADPPDHEKVRTMAAIFRELADALEAKP